MKKKYYTLTIALAIYAAIISLATNAHAQTISTFAGNGTGALSGDGGAATAASVRYPYHVTFDGSGNMYIADWGNNAIRKITPSGIISTLAGKGVPLYGGDGGVATAAYLNQPAGIVIDGSGNIIFSDNGNNRIRKIDGSGNISTIAGTGTTGYLGDGGAATSACITNARGLCLDASGNLYIADAGNMVIRKITTSGIISTVAGNNTAGYSGDGGAATAAQLNTPKDIAFDAAGNMYISDNLNHVIRMVTPAGTISTIAGVGLPGYSGDGGPATIASLKYPDGLQIDAAGNMYISDGGNNRVRVIKVSGKIFTVAGTGTYSYSGDGGPATAATMKSPTATTKDASGNLYIADTDNRIRKVTPTPLTMSGGGSFCEGATTTMTGSIPDGSWTSSNTTVATVGTSGTVTAVAAGTAIITYTESMVSATETITVTPMPAAITGASSVCVAATTTLANSVAGGAWTSSDGSIATVDASGTVTGGAVGIVGITYNISGCYVTSPLVVTTCTPTYLPVNPNSTDVAVYPNPAGQYFTIALPSGTTSVSVIDLMGKEIMKIAPAKQVQNITLQTTGITPGSYIINTTTGSSIYKNTITIIK